MKIGDVRQMSADQLEDEILKLKKEQLENTSRVRIIRRDIAKMKTVVREKKAPDAGASAKKSGK